jgi:hypothetical protein
MHDVLDPYEVETVERLPNYEALKKIAETNMEKQAAAHSSKKRAEGLDRIM